MLAVDALPQNSNLGSHRLQNSGIRSHGAVARKSCWGWEMTRIRGMAKLLRRGCAWRTRCA